jgi:hypothetical protein
MPYWLCPFRPGFIKGTVNTGANTFTFSEGKIMPPDFEKISDMKVLNGTLFVLGYLSGANGTEQKLYVYNTGTLAELGSAAIKPPSATITTTMEANIAGWGENEMYVYYYEYNTSISGIIKIDTVNCTISDRKDWS